MIETEERKIKEREAVVKEQEGKDAKAGKVRYKKKEHHDDEKKSEKKDEGNEKKDGKK